MKKIFTNNLLALAIIVLLLCCVPYALLWR